MTGRNLALHLEACGDWDHIYAVQRREMKIGNGSVRHGSPPAVPRRPHPSPQGSVHYMALKAGFPALRSYPLTDTFPARVVAAKRPIRPL